MIACFFQLLEEATCTPSFMVSFSIFKANCVVSSKCFFFLTLASLILSPLILTLLPFLPLISNCNYTESTHNPMESLHHKTVKLITFSKSPLLYKLIYSHILGMWTLPKAPILSIIPTSH